MIFGETLENGVKDESQKIFDEITSTMNNVESSNFYHVMKNSFQTEKYLNRFSHSPLKFQVDIYGLDSTEYNFDSQFYLAVVLQLRQDFPQLIGDIEICDSLISSADIAAFEKLNLKVFSMNDHSRMKAQRPTIFYITDLDYDFIGNLLRANWSPACLNESIWMAYSLEKTFNYMKLTNRNNLETKIRLERILKFTTEVRIKTWSEQTSDSFKGYSWHFFEVDTITDIDVEKLEHCSDLRKRYLYV